MTCVGLCCLEEVSCKGLCSPWTLTKITPEKKSSKLACYDTSLWTDRPCWQRDQTVIPQGPFPWLQVSPESTRGDNSQCSRAGGSSYCLLGDPVKVITWAPHNPGTQTSHLQQTWIIQNRSQMTASTGAVTQQTSSMETVVQSSSSVFPNSNPGVPMPWKCSAFSGLLKVKVYFTFKAVL